MRTKLSFVLMKTNQIATDKQSIKKPNKQINKQTIDKEAI